MQSRFKQNYFSQSDKPFFDEWLETNGLGGYASSTLSGMNTRRYHGLLVAATVPPVGREVLVAKVDEQLDTIDGIIKLSSNEFGRNVYADGKNCLQEFSRELFPSWTYLAGDVQLKKTIACIHNKNTTVILYEMTGGDLPVTLQLRPLLTARTYHALKHAGDFGNIRTLSGDEMLTVKFEKENREVYIKVNGFGFEFTPHWYYNFTYSRERERGFDDSEDLYMPGVLSVRLFKGKKAGIVLTTDPEEISNPFLLFEEEKNRREKLLNSENDGTIKQLLLAADQFIVKRGLNKKTIIAGYHWFSDWGRDTMIALPGLCLYGGRLKDAEKILVEFKNHVSEGMIPNLFPDGSTSPEYNTIDGTLWYFIAIYEYLMAGGNEKKIIEEFLPVLGNIIDRHYLGTRYGIKVDKDGLLAGGHENIQLTWMDARINDRVITPRAGKAVEINSLWYNALTIYALLLGKSGNESQAREFEKQAELTKKSFLEKFWNESKKCLYDVLNGDLIDDSIRPNQVFAISLPFALLTGEKAKQVMTVVEEHLLTPAGLRSLAPGSKDYKPFYRGNNVERDEAYHQGTVWSWLIGPYIDALIKTEGNEGRKKAEKYIQKFLSHWNEACVGSISEIFDGDFPHHPKGTVAQAWSVGELLRLIKKYGLKVPEDKGGEGKKVKDVSVA